MNKRARTEVISYSCMKLLVIIFHDKINEMTLMLEELLLENKTLKNKVAYLEEKITKIIKQQIEEKRKNQ